MEIHDHTWNKKLEKKMNNQTKPANWRRQTRIKYYFFSVRTDKLTHLILYLLCPSHFTIHIHIKIDRVRLHIKTGIYLQYIYKLNRNSWSYLQQEVGKNWTIKPNVQIEEGRQESNFYFFQGQTRINWI